MESLGNDDVSTLNARKCVPGNDDVNAENARRRYGYCDTTITGGYVRVSFECFLKDLFSFYSDVSNEVVCEKGNKEDVVVVVSGGRRGKIVR